MAGYESNVPATWQIFVKENVPGRNSYGPSFVIMKKGGRWIATEKAIIDLPVEWCWRIAEGWAWLYASP